MPFHCSGFVKVRFGTNKRPVCSVLMYDKRKGGRETEKKIAGRESKKEVAL